MSTTNNTGSNDNAAANSGQPKGSDIQDIVDTSGLTYTYQFVSDPAMSALLPEDWTDAKSEDWVIDGKVVGKKFSAAADLKKFGSCGAQPGVSVSTLTDQPDPIKVQEWLDKLDLW